MTPGSGCCGSTGTGGGGCTPGGGGCTSTGGTMIGGGVCSCTCTRTPGARTTTPGPEGGGATITRGRPNGPRTTTSAAPAPAQAHRPSRLSPQNQHVFRTALSRVVVAVAGAGVGAGDTPLIIVPRARSGDNPLTPFPPARTGRSARTTGTGPAAYPAVAASMDRTSARGAPMSATWTCPSHAA